MGIVRASLVVRLAIVTIMTKLRVACLSEAASLAPVEDRMVKGLLLEDKVAKIPLMVVMMAKGHLHLLLTQVAFP